MGIKGKEQESAYQEYSPEDLMRSFQQGENADQCFHILYEKFKRPIFFFIKSMTHGQEQLSEELTHEAFLRLYKARHQFNFEVKFTTWFWTIARNLTIDELRKKNPLNWSLNFSQEEANPVDGLADLTEEIEVLYLEKVNRQQLYQVIESLKPRQREVILLRIASELSFEEMGRVLEQKPNAVKALYFRAKSNLIKCIADKNELKVVI